MNTVTSRPLVRPAVQRGADLLAAALTRHGWTVTVTPGRPRPVTVRTLHVEVADAIHAVRARVIVAPTHRGGTGRRYRVESTQPGRDIRNLFTLRDAATLTHQYAADAQAARTLARRYS